MVINDEDVSTEYKKKIIIKVRKRKISKNLLPERRVNFTVQLPIATGSQI